MSLRLLWVATKAPWPPRDGGRLLQLETLRLLAAPGAAATETVEVDLVAPVPAREQAAVAAALAPFCRPLLVAARAWPLPLATLLAAARGWPVTAARHRLIRVGRAVAAAAAAGDHDVVHAEQVQAMPQALAARLPVLLRAQNVESELWRGARAGAERGGTGEREAAAPSARGAGPLTAWRRGEAARLARWEGKMVARAALTLALSERDAAALAGLAPAARVETLPVPFPSELPAGPQLPGSPAVTLLCGEGWRPNREGAEAFVAGTWPRVRALLPQARLHVFGEAGGGGVGVVRHRAPADAALAFAAGALLVVPLTIASGIRMKVLEAWARGMPVVLTPAAAAGLAAAPGDQVVVAELGAALAAALVALAGDPGRQRGLISAGRELLARRHDPAQIRRRLLAGYSSVVATAAARG